MSNYPHNYQPSILSFLQLNVNKVAKDLKLAKRGSERGKKDEPATDSVIFDNVENEVLEFAEGEIKNAHAALLDDLSIYAQRIHALDLEGRFSVIEAAAMNGISSFRSEVKRGQNQLSLVGQRLHNLKEEMADFKNRNSLKRTAHYPHTAGKILQWGIIALLFLAEIVGNSYFLAKGSAYGLIGGFAEAVIIAFLNIGVSITIGMYGLQQLWHRAPGRKFIGFLSLILWVAFAGVFNLLVAHYREAAGAFLDGGGKIALTAIQSNPLGLTDFQSWVLFGIGALFAFIALVDALSMDDLYPFYGKLDRTHERAREGYVDELDDLIANLEELKTDTIDAMQIAKDDLNKRRGEHGSILEGRARAVRGFDQHVTYLERAANTLMSIYREANGETRKSQRPQRFKEPWSALRPPGETEATPQILPPEKLEASVAKAQESLDERMREVHAEFEEALKTYRGLEDVMEA